MEEERSIDTPFAWFERIAEQVVVQRWKPGITLDRSTIKATMELRHQHFGHAPYVAVVIVPFGTHFAMSFLEQDQYADPAVARSMFAMANVVEEEDVRAIVSLYYAQHPPAYRFGVFPSLPEAMTWVDERLAEHRRGIPKT